MNGRTNVPLRAGRAPVRDNFPWESIFVSLLLTLVGLYLLRGRLAGGSVKGSAVASLAFLALGAASAMVSPQRTTEMFLACQIPLYLLSNSGAIGNQMIAYLSTVIAGVVFAKRYASPGRIRPTPGTAFALGLVSLAVLQWFRASDRVDSLFGLLNLGTFALVLAGWDDRNGIDYWRLRLSFVCGVLVSSVPVLVHEYPIEVRLGEGLGLNPNLFGHMAGLAVVFTITLRVRDRYTILKLAGLAFLGVFIAFTGSRMAIYGTACCLLLIPLLEGNAKRTLASVLPLAALALFDLTFDVSDTTALSYRIVSPFIDTFDVSGAKRQQIWAYCLDLLRDHWVVGVGFGNIPNYTAQAGLMALGVGLQSHNIYLTLAIEMGIAGVLLVVLLQFCLLAYGLRRRRKAALFVSVVVFFIIEGALIGTNLTFLSAVAILMALRTVEDRGRLLGGSAERNG